jgi:phosphatidate cytidylyltransferase
MRRFVTGTAIFICWLLLLLKTPFPIFWLAILFTVGFMLHEFTRMALGDFNSKDRYALVILGLFPVAAAYTGSVKAINGILLPAFLLLFLHIFSSYGRRENSFKMLYRGVFAIIYIGMLSAHVILLRLLDGGPFWLLYLTAVIIASDSGAYYGGTLFGRHKLCPSISPGKTVEGLIAGVSSALIAAGLMHHFLRGTDALYPMLILAGLLALIGVVGDLVESIIKRAAGVKDSGMLLPGHGGIFDRLDSLLLCVPVLYYTLEFGLVP